MEGLDLPRRDVRIAGQRIGDEAYILVTLPAGNGQAVTLVLPLGEAEALCSTLRSAIDLTRLKFRADVEGRN